MKRISKLFYIAALALAMLTSCGSKNELEEIQNNRESQAEATEFNIKDEELAKSTASSEGSSDEENGIVILTVDLWASAMYMDGAIKAFEEEYPNIKIELSQAPKVDLDRYNPYISTAIMSGAASDIIQISDDNMYTFANSPYFADLYDFINSDQEFDKSDYYMNVLEMLENNEGRLPFLPGGFSISYAGVNSGNKKDVEIFSAYNTISRNNQIEIYKQLEAENQLQLSGAFVLRDIILSDEYVDFKNRTCGYSTPEFIIALEEALELGATGNYPYVGEYLKENADKYLFLEVSDFARRVFLPDKEPYTNFGESKNTPNEFVAFKPFADSHGRIKCLFGHTPCMAINANASPEKQEAAWLFIKFLTTEEAYKYVDTAIILNMPQFFLNKELSKTFMYEYYEDYIKKELDSELSDVIIEDINAIVEQQHLALEGELSLDRGYRPSTFLSAINPIAMGLAAGQITAGQASVQLTSMAETFFKE